MQLLSTANTKTLKGERRGYRTFILHLAPGNLSGHQVCPKASAGCLSACLNTSGRGVFRTIQQARIRKTQWFFADRFSFMAALHKDIASAIKASYRSNLIPVFRLNGTSDIVWEKISYSYQGIHYRNVFEAFPDVRFYDYTKRTNRLNLPSNYSLTFSRSETNELDCRIALKEGKNVAAVFSVALPTEYLGRRVINGDESDLRFLDPKDVIVGLKAKGKAKKDCSGFVVAC